MSSPRYTFVKGGKAPDSACFLVLDNYQRLVYAMSDRRGPARFSGTVAASAIHMINASKPYKISAADLFPRLRSGRLGKSVVLGARP